MEQKENLSTKVINIRQLFIENAEWICLQNVTQQIIMWIIYKFAIKSKYLVH